MLKSFVYYIVFFLLLSCNNHFGLSQAGVKRQKAIIRSFIKAEDNRDSVLLKELLSDTIAVYWKMKDPNRQKIIDVYTDYWTKNKFSKNTVQSITPVAKNIYLVKTFFEVQRIEADTALHFESTIVYKLNTANKIVYVAKE